MNPQLPSLEINTQENRNQTQENKNQLKEILELISEMNLIKLEPHIDPQVNKKLLKEKQPSKYQLLAVLRDLFLEFKASGDTSIKIEQGKCYSGCYGDDCSVINLSGNNSGHNFAFVIEKSNDSMTFHTCPFFMDDQKEFKKINTDFLYNVRKKIGLMNGEEEELYDKYYKERMISEIDLVYQTTQNPDLKKTFDSIMAIAKKTQ